jgi:hypothetical protein
MCQDLRFEEALLPCWVPLLLRAALVIPNIGSSSSFPARAALRLPLVVNCGGDQQKLRRERPCYL